MIEAMFPDGKIVRGATYRECEDAMRAAEWTVFGSRRAFRREMRRRAVLWTGCKVSFRPCRTSKGFLNQLANAGLVRIDKTTEGRLI